MSTLPQGKGYSVNVPLVQGIDTEQYLALFKPIMRCVWRVLLLQSWQLCAAAGAGAVLVLCWCWCCAGSVLVLPLPVPRALQADHEVPAVWGCCPAAAAKLAMLYIAKCPRLLLSLPACVPACSPHHHLLSCRKAWCLIYSPAASLPPCLPASLPPCSKVFEVFQPGAVVLQCGESSS